MLREELHAEIRAQDSIVKICLTSTTAILAFAFSQNLSLILLATYPVIYFLLSFFIMHRKRMLRISGYMIVYLEDSIGFTWETHNNLAYQERKNGGSKLFWRFPYYHFWGVLAIMALLSSFIIDWINHLKPTPLSVFLYHLHVLAIILIYCTSYILAKTSQIRETEVEYWKQVKKRIESNKLSSLVL